MKFINPAVLICLTLQLALLAAPDSRADDAAIDAGMRAYHEGNYKSAAASFRKAIEAAPQDSSLHHWLGKCYGRIAENGNWFTALSHAGKTLKQFRKAVELDTDNYEALRDLIDYLETAPGFMGGNRLEARQLRQRLEALHYAREESDN